MLKKDLVLLLSAIDDDTDVRIMTHSDVQEEFELVITMDKHRESIAVINPLFSGGEECVSRYTETDL